MINVQRAFAWSIIDIFIILNSIPINFRLKQILYRVKNLSSKNTEDLYCWRTLRENYYCLFKLFHLMNKQYSLLILQSFIINLYYLLTHTFSLFKSMESPLINSYVYISFMLLILRTASVCLFCSRIYETYTEISINLNQVPARCYNIEVKIQFTKKKIRKQHWKIFRWKDF